MKYTGLYYIEQLVYHSYIFYNLSRFTVYSHKKDIYPVKTYPLSDMYTLFTSSFFFSLQDCVHY